VKPLRDLAGELYQGRVRYEEDRLRLRASLDSVQRVEENVGSNHKVSRILLEVCSRDSSSRYTPWSAVWWSGKYPVFAWNAR